MYCKGWILVLLNSIHLIIVMTSAKSVTSILIPAVNENYLNKKNTTMDFNEQSRKASLVWTVVRIFPINLSIKAELFHLYYGGKTSVRNESTPMCGPQRKPNFKLFPFYIQDITKGPNCPIRPGKYPYDNIGQFAFERVMSPKDFKGLEYLIMYTLADGPTEIMIYGTYLNYK